MMRVLNKKLLANERGKLGETKPFTVIDHLINSMAKAEAKDFEEHARLLGA